MKIDKAKEISEAYEALIIKRKELKDCDTVKAFTKVRFFGEDGTERESSFYLKDDYAEVALEAIINKLIEEIHDLEKIIIDM